jgi:hypothetical protein
MRMRKDVRFLQPRHVGVAECARIAKAVVFVCVEVLLSVLVFVRVGL